MKLELQKDEKSFRVEAETDHEKFFLKNLIASILRTYEKTEISTWTNGVLIVGKQERNTLEGS